MERERSQLYQGIGVFFAVNGLSTQFLETAAGVAKSPEERMVILIGAFMLLFISWPAFVFNLREAYKTMMESKVRAKYPAVTHATLKPTEISLWFRRRTFRIKLQVSGREDMECRDNEPALECLKPLQRAELCIFWISMAIAVATLTLNWHIFLKEPEDPNSITYNITNFAPMAAPANSTADSTAD